MNTNDEEYIDDAFDGDDISDEVDENNHNAANRAMAANRHI